MLRITLLYIDLCLRISKNKYYTILTYPAPNSLNLITGRLVPGCYTRLIPQLSTCSIFGQSMPCCWQSVWMGFRP